MYVAYCKAKCKSSKRSTTVSSEEPGWPKQHAQVRAKLKLGTSKWTPGRTVPGVESERGRDLLDIAYQAYICKKEKDPTLELADVYVDVSQSAKHFPWIFRGLRSVTTSSVYFSFGRERLLHPQELFSVMGFGRPVFTQLSNSALQTMLGECMALPCVAVPLFGLITGAFPEKWSRTSGSENAALTE
eukprot:6475619-Amphidinium_carterae.1